MKENFVLRAYKGCHLFRGAQSVAFVVVLVVVMSFLQLLVKPFVR